MEAKFSNYGNSPASFGEMETGKVGQFNDVQGGGAKVDPNGTSAAKKNDSMNMNAGIAFNKKFFNKVEAMGTDSPKENNKGQKTEKGDHFTVSTDVDAMGTDCAKGSSYQSDR